MIVAKKRKLGPLFVILGGALVAAGGATWMTVAAIQRSLNRPAIEIVDSNGNPVQAADIEAPVDSSGLPVLFNAPKYALRNQLDQPVSNQTLEGHPYVAAFIFTNCTTICPMMTGKMSDLQTRIDDPRIKLVSFTVDPERDTPAVLKQYGEKFKADANRWFFLTGTVEQMTAVETGFHVRVPDNIRMAGGTTNNNGPEHSDRFILVDQKGRVRGIYDAKDERAMALLKVESSKLANVK